MAVVAAIAAVTLSHADDDQPSAIDGPWRFTTDNPAQGWEKSSFDDSQWKEGYGGFGTRGTPNARINTEWDTNDIWVRRTIELDEIPESPALFIHHDEDTEVYINGTQVAKVTGYITDYKVIPLSAEGKKVLKRGKNLLAAHTHQTGGGQYIDFHLVDANDVPQLPPAKPPTKPYQSELITPWGEKVTPENVWQEYPRPQMELERWTNLNGKWNYAITSDQTREAPQQWDGQILVPFSLESKLSGVNRLLQPDQALWYQRTIELEPQENQRTLLNFEAVDYSCHVYLNGTEVGQHVGGSVPFQLDVTEAAKQGENSLVVRVEDKTGGFQLRGKQSIDPEGIWYTRVSGIWQTVWLEQVPTSHLTDVKIHTEAETGRVVIRPEDRVHIVVFLSSVSGPGRRRRNGRALCVGGGCRF
jgi:beta-galactosidase